MKYLALLAAMAIAAWIMAQNDVVFKITGGTIMIGIIVAVVWGYV